MTSQNRYYESVEMINNRITNKKHDDFEKDQEITVNQTVDSVSSSLDVNCDGDVDVTDERCCGDRLPVSSTLILTISRKFDKHFVTFFTDFFLIASALALFLLIGESLSYSKYELEAFRNLAILWLSSIVGAFSAKICGLPSLMGMIGSGILVTNTSNNITIPETWNEIVRASGLAIVLVRSGLELDISSVQKSGFMTMRLTFLPGLFEALTCGFLSAILFQMPLLLGLSLGCLLAAVSPAVVVVGMLELQSLGYGVAKGIPSLVIAAASFDDIAAIAGFSFMIEFAIKAKSKGMLQMILHGPLSILLGISSGCLGGILVSLTKIWNVEWKRSAMIIVSVLIIMFTLKAYSFSGSGAIGALTVGVVASFCWKSGIPERFAKESNQSFVNVTEHHISILWDLMFEPLLFVVIGSVMKFDLIPDGTLIKSLIVVMAGIFVRMATAFLCTCGAELNFNERLFISLAWIPKATVQAALCSFPLVLINQEMSSNEMFSDYVTWGNQILSTAIISIVVTAPLGLIVIQYFGPKCLSKDDVSGLKDEHNVQRYNGDELIDLLSQLELSIRHHVPDSVDNSIKEDINQMLWQCRSMLIGENQDNGRVLLPEC